MPSPKVRECFLREPWKLGIILALAAALPQCSTLDKARLPFRVTDYQTAERLQRATGRPAVYVLFEGNHERDVTFEKMLGARHVRRACDGNIRCLLLRSDPEDRRFAAQYGVERAPAVIIVHGDGTYHALCGPMDASAVAEFISTSSPPGSVSQSDKNLAHDRDLNWAVSWEDARTRAANEGRPVFIAAYRTVSQDWHKLGPLLYRPELRRRIDGMVPLKLTTMNTLAQTLDTPVGAVKLPSVIVVMPDGRSDVLERPLSCESIVAFIDRNAAARVLSEDRIEPVSGAP